jgi:hypothetical protein
VHAWNVAVLRAGEARFEGLGDVTNHGGKHATVSALAFAGGRLHLGGTFTSVGPLDAHHWVVHDGTAWSVPQELDNAVRTLTPRGGGVLVGGDFDNAGPLRVQHLGVWTGTGWELLGQGPHSGYFSGGEVMSLLGDGAGVIAGGLFDQAGAVRLGSVGRWSGTAWDDLGGGVTADVGHGQVFALARIGEDVYAAGSFSGAGGVPARNVARWDGRRWSRSARAPTAPSTRSPSWAAGSTPVGASPSPAAGSWAASPSGTRRRRPGPPSAAVRCTTTTSTPWP